MIWPIFTLVWRFLTEKPWQFALAVLLCSLGLSSAVGVLWLQSTLENHAKRQAQGIDIVVGAKGSALQNVLAVVYQVDVPNGNISLADAEALANNPMVKNMVPVSMGDSVNGVRIVGVNEIFYALYEANLAIGKMPQAPLDAVLGAAAARSLKLVTGDQFVGTHGLMSEEDDHDDDHARTGKDTMSGANVHAAHPFRVVGVLKPTGRVIDNLVMTPLESVWLVHQAHMKEGAATRPEITFALIQTRGPIGVAMLPRMINTQTGLQAAVPALESARLLTTFGWVVWVVEIFATILVFSAMAALLGALWQALQRREADIAVLRAMGVGRLKIAMMVLLETFILVSLAALIALGILACAGTLAERSLGLLMPMGWSLGWGLWLKAYGAATLLAILATMPVLWRALRLDVAVLLSAR